MNHKILGLFSLLILSAVAYAQTGMDSTTAASPVKTLTLKQYNTYLNGPDLSALALPATMNDYPMPDRVLKLQRELKLTAAQVDKVKGINSYLQLKKTEIGQSIIRNEKALDRLFSTHKVDDGNIIFFATQSGSYQGEYRTAVLSACYNTYKVLTPVQLSTLRGLKNHN
ncbi:hypothetical protein HH214_15025 [Mucilaginibacter robiniae]|uniref:DUF4252 domain-containing protein n=1 Tax=Mucilaginibacter robiniae TaxID=2728022 RepID=A0A7L5E3V6_9SPHI|nr:hypothetical protein [Mucilaginibacter robiniae]QJD97087.1 hypothetical protein HH214_15025 [Mucilaginibacter robiniae]